MRVAVLAFRSVAKAVGEYRFQTIEIVPNDIDFLIGHNAREVLTHTLAHDPRFPMVHLEALFG